MVDLAKLRLSLDTVPCASPIPSRPTEQLPACLFVPVNAVWHYHCGERATAFNPRILTRPIVTVPPTNTMLCISETAVTIITYDQSVGVLTRHTVLTYGFSAQCGQVFRRLKNARPGLSVDDTCLCASSLYSGEIFPSFIPRSISCCPACNCFGVGCSDVNVPIKLIPIAFLL